MNYFVYFALLLCLFVTLSTAFPRDFDDDDNFFNERRPHHRRHRKHYASSDEEDDENNDGRRSVYRPTKSQNRKYLARTPAHDKHFEKIMRQQDEATIKSPKQALMVASDESRMKNRLRNSLQTSDDDIYEVESAPVMKSAPYDSGITHKRRRPLAYKKPDEELELPISVGFESDVDHGNYEETKQRPAPRYRRPSSWKYHGNDHNLEQTRYRPKKMYPNHSSNPTNLHMTLGLSNDESRMQKSGNYMESASLTTPASSTTYHHQYPSAYSQVPAPVTPASYHQQHLQHQSQLYATSPYNPSALRGASLTPATTSAGAPMASAPIYSTRTHPMESAWLDMGAYSSGKGAFGWYSDVPVGL